MNSIKELKAKKADVKGRMAAIATKETDDAPLSDDDVASFNSLKEECDRLEARIARLSAAMDEDADKADPVDDDAEKSWAGKAVMNVKTFNINTSNDCRVPTKKDGERAGRWMVGQYFVKEYGLRAAQDMVEKTWGDDMVRKTMLTTSQPIIPQDFNPDFVKLLQAKAVVRAAGPTVYSMPNGNMTIPRQNTGSTGSWFGEGTQITVSNLTMDNIQMTWHKYGALTYTSRELLEFSPLEAASIISEDLASRLALLEDATFLTATTGTYNPKGILGLVAAGNIVANTVNGSSAVDFQTVSADLANQELLLSANNVDIGDTVYFMNPSVGAFLGQLSSSFGVYPFKDQIAAGVLNNHKIFYTTQLATNLGSSSSNKTNIILAKPSHLIVGDAYRYALSMTTEGSFVDSSTQVNAFGQDLVAWKLTNACDFKMKHDVSAAVLQAVGWTLGYTHAAASAYTGQTADTTGSSASSASA